MYYFSTQQAERTVSAETPPLALGKQLRSSVRRCAARLNGSGALTCALTMAAWV